MLLPMMRHQDPVFTPPATPAAKCLFLMRHSPLTTRSELVEASDLSQPTVTRAVAALIDAGLVHQRTDLTRSHGRGRPTIPLELSDSDWVHAGLAVGTHSTYVGLFDVRGRTIREANLDLPVGSMAHDDVIEHLIAGVNRLTMGLPRPLVAVGVTFPGVVGADGIVNAPSLGWHDVDIAARLRYQFSVPATISAAVPAILGAELHSLAGHVKFNAESPVSLALFADDSIGAAVSSSAGVRQVDVDLASDSILPTAGLLAGTSASSLPELVADTSDETRELLDRRARELGELAASLITAHSPSTVVVAGSAFIDDAQAPAKFARSVREALGPRIDDVNLRLIPTHDEIVRAIARAVALDHLLRDPLSLR